LNRIEDRHRLRSSLSGAIADLDVFLGAGAAVFHVLNPKCAGLHAKPKVQPSENCNTSTVKMTMAGASSNAQIQGLSEAITKSSYLRGNDESKWLKEISNFQKVVYHQIYPGVNMIFHSSGQRLEYDFVVAPGSDPNLIRVNFEGANKVKIGRNGDLILKFKGFEIRHQNPWPIR